MNNNQKGFILIVDDNDQNIQYLGTLLSENDYEVGLTQSGQQALTFLKDTRPDLILLDIRMPEMSGFEVCKKIKNDSSLKNIPIIFITANTDSDDIVKAFKTGGLDYITKPFNPDELLARVNTHIQLKFKSDEVLQLQLQRKELMHTVCHDIANPITTTLTILKVLESNPEKLKQSIPRMYRSQKNCIRLLDIVKQMFALEEGKVNLQINSHNLLEQVMSSKELIENKLKEKGIILNININKELYVKIDSTSFVISVLSNIFTNAIKFSNSTSTIEISASIKDDDVCISIKDHGVGMPQAITDNLFNPSYPTSRKGTEGERGTGFGMPIMKRFVELYGGTVEVFSTEFKENELKHGTEVKITLKAA
jgi:DNA-binding response OmpR family regulator/anti-sigma regulatory factor (Ser/Thr protein kinase)